MPLPTTVSFHCSMVLSASIMWEYPHFRISMILGEPNFITCRPAIYKSPTARVMGIIDSTLENHMDSCSFIDYILCSSAYNWLIPTGKWWKIQFEKAFPIPPPQSLPPPKLRHRCSMIRNITIQEEPEQNEKESIYKLIEGILRTNGIVLQQLLNGGTSYEVRAKHRFPRTLQVASANQNKGLLGEASQTAI